MNSAIVFLGMMVLGAVVAYDPSNTGPVVTVDRPTSLQYEEEEYDYIHSNGDHCTCTRLVAITHDQEPQVECKETVITPPNDRPIIDRKAYFAASAPARGTYGQQRPASYQDRVVAGNHW